MDNVKIFIKKCYESLPESERKVLKRAAIVFAALFLILFIFFINQKAKNYSLLNNTYVSAFRYLFDFRCFMKALILSACLTWIYILFRYKPNDFRNKPSHKDNEKNINIAKNSTSGSAHFMTFPEVVEAYGVMQPGEPYATIYGKLKKEMDSEQRIVTFKPKFGVDDGSALQNTLILGNSGSGKSYSFVRTEIINSILRGDSVLVSDPSGELYTDLSYWCKQKGVDVKALNLTDLDHSDGWDCLTECINPETKRLDGSLLNGFITIYLENTPNGGKEKGFWQGQNISYLKAAIAYLFWQKELHILMCYKSLYKKVTKGVGDFLIYGDRFDGDVSFTWCEKKIKEAAIANGFDIEEIDKAISLAEASAPRCAIGDVKGVLNNYEKMVNFYKNRPFPEGDAGKGAYDDIRHSLSSQNISSSVLSGVLNELSLFTDKKLAYVLSTPGIVTSDINKRQSIYFLCVDVQSDELKPVASLFASFLLKNAYEQYNRESSIAKEKGIKHSMVNTTVMLDEFYSLGKLGGSTNYFTGYIANSRKSHMHTNIILQNITQIPAVYGDDLFNTIVSNCLTTIVLGANDPETCKYVSDFLCGETTVITETHTEKIGILNRPTTDEVNVSAQTRKLMTVDEVRRFKDGILLIKHGEQPVVLDIFPYTEHPVCQKGELIPQSFSSSIKSYEDKLIEDTICNKKPTGNDFKEYVDNLCHRVIDDATGEVLLVNDHVKFPKEFDALLEGNQNKNEASGKNSPKGKVEPKSNPKNRNRNQKSRADLDNVIEINNSNTSILNDD